MAPSAAGLCGARAPIRGVGAPLARCPPPRPRDQPGRRPDRRRRRPRSPPSRSPASAAIPARFPDLRLTVITRMPRWSPRYQATGRPPIRTSSRCARSASATRAATWCGREGVGQRRRRRGRARGACSTALHHAREHLLASSRRWRSSRWLDRRLRHGPAASPAIVDTPRDLDRVRGEPRWRPVRPHGVAVSRHGARTASRTPARRRSAPMSTATTATHWACCGGSSSAKSADTYHGSSRVLDARGPRDPRFHGEPPRRWDPADQDGDHVPHRRRAGPLAVRLHARRRSRTT